MNTELSENVSEFLRKYQLKSNISYSDLGIAWRDLITDHPHLIVFLIALNEPEVIDNLPYDLLIELWNCTVCRSWFRTEPQIYLALKSRQDEIEKKLDLLSQLLRKQIREYMKHQAEGEREKMLNSLFDLGMIRIDITKSPPEITRNVGYASSSGKRKEIEIKTEEGMFKLVRTLRGFKLEKQS